MYYPEKEPKPAEDTKITIAYNIRRVLDDRRITRKTLAEMSGVTERVIACMVDTKNPNTTIDNLCKVARALGVSLDWLTGIDEYRYDEERNDPFKDPNLQQMLRDALDTYCKNKAAKSKF